MMMMMMMMIVIQVQRATDQDAQSAYALGTSHEVWGRAKLRNYNKVVLLKVPKTQEAKNINLKPLYPYLIYLLISGPKRPSLPLPWPW
jgi:hypothetical protein